MFGNIKKLIAQERELYDNLCKAQLEAKTLQTQNTQLLAKIESAEKRGGVLLLEDLSEDLVRKLQELTDDNVIILFLNDGTRMEIRKDGTSYRKDKGFIR